MTKFRVIGKFLWVAGGMEPGKVDRVVDVDEDAEGAYWRGAAIDAALNAEIPPLYAPEWEIDADDYKFRVIRLGDEELERAERAWAEQERRAIGYPGLFDGGEAGDG